MDGLELEGDYSATGSTQMIVLSDRLTHILPKSEDHPTLFAKGCADDRTPSGVFFQSIMTTDPDPVPVPVPAGRVFNDDSCIAFDPREEFAGRRPGFVFRLGSQGLGYYEDR